MSGSNIKGKITLTSEMLKELDQIQDSAKKSCIEWTPEMDAYILAGWPLKIKSEFTKWFNGKYGFGGENSIRKRYRTLIQNEKE